MAGQLLGPGTPRILALLVRLRDAHRLHRHGGAWGHGHLYAVRELDDGPHNANAPPNLVLIPHDDGSMDVYSHLMHDGVRVTVGQVVQTGDVIALSGNTGYADNHPHLHSSVHGCDSVPGFEDGPLCEAIPFTFRNVQPPDVVLLQVHEYTAGP